MADWDARYLEKAQQVSEWSKDPSTRTGAVIVSPYNRIVAVGFNGFPPGIADDERLSNRELKYEIIIHCEVNALVSAAQDVHGFTLYTWPFASCSRCAAIMLGAGITRFVFPPLPDHLVERWGNNIDTTKALFAEAGVIFNEWHT